jgi:hypothetical protein
MPAPIDSEFLLEIPLDASKIEDYQPGQNVKVVVRGARQTQSRVVGFDDKRQACAQFHFAEAPGPLAVLLGPAEATDDEIAGMQTLTIQIASREWAAKRALKITPIVIPPLYWHRWPLICRGYVIRGRVVCPDAGASPVPAAKVCAYDVDHWFHWSSTHLIGCATTDVHGAFEMRFRWCCNWWPWWWWRDRIWELNPLLAERIAAILHRYPDIRFSGIARQQPSLEPFRELLAPTGIPVRKTLSVEDLDQLETVRTKLMTKLPRIAELEALKIWPWWPWWPWRDCAPDVIFKVTQDCLTPGAVIVNETVADTRWNITSPLEVTLTAKDSACCIHTCPNPPCQEGECVQVSQVCALPVNEIAGNLGAPAEPATLNGLYRPGAVAAGVPAWDGDRPFGGVVPLVKTGVTMLNVDYYEIEYLDGVSWVALPPGVAVGFYRRWIENVPGFPVGDIAFNFTTISGHQVVESREHFEAHGGLGGWGVTRYWLYNDNLVVPIDSTKFPAGDGVYRFRVIGWQLAGGNLVNRRELPICGAQDKNYVLICFDNRVYDAVTHDTNHHCGNGVHLCTQEPDTHISAVRINGTPVGVCGSVNAAAGNLEVDFQVTDASGYLGWYTLIATYGLNQSVNLLDRAGASVIALAPAIQTGWDPAVGPPAKNSAGTYGVALSQGATPPLWYGGHFRLTVPAANAFPEPCCYQLELRAYKRTIVGGGGPLVFSCDAGYPYRNLTEFSIGVGVCPPPK